MKLLLPNQRQFLPRRFPGTTKNLRKATRIVDVLIVVRSDRFLDKIRSAIAYKNLSRFPYSYNIKDFYKIRY